MGEGEGGGRGVVKCVGVVGGGRVGVVEDPDPADAEGALVVDAGRRGSNSNSGKRVG